jgi:hypothetical protein
MGNCCVKKSSPVNESVKTSEKKQKKFKQYNKKPHDEWVLYTKANNKWINTKWAPKLDEKIKTYAARIERQSHEVLPTIGRRERELFLREKFLAFLPLDVQKKLKSTGANKWEEIVEDTARILETTKK